MLALAGLTCTLSASVALQSQNFGQVSVSASSAAVTVSYSFAGLSAAPSFALAYGTEFTAPTASCTVVPITNCTIAVTFAPKWAGLRQDAQIVKDQSGNLLATTFLHGIGLAPQMTLTPGIISTVAGDGAFGFGGDGSAATSASLANPTGVALDAAGNIYIADSINQVIRKVSAATGVISTVAGTPFAVTPLGDGGPAKLATLNNPTGVAVDAAGNLYIADQGNGRIREVTAATGIITTVAGGGAGGGSDGWGDGGPATSAILSGPNDVAVDASGNIYIADSWHGAIREVSAATGTISLLAGDLDNPTSVGVDAVGNVYIADTGDCLIRQVNTSGIINVIAGNGNQGYSGDFGPAIEASLAAPTGVRVDAAGNVYIADSSSSVIRKVAAATGIITTIAGTGSSGYGGDGGPATLASLGNPSNLALDAAGNLYIADYSNNRIRKVTVSASSLSFSNTNVGQASTSQFVTVSNAGTQSLSLSALTLSANFEQQASGYVDCSSSSAIVAGSNCIAAIAFAPSTSGALSGTLKVTGNSLNAVGSYQSAALSGTGTGGAVPVVSLSPTSVSFGSLSVGSTSAAQTVTLSNTGSAPLGILSIWLTGVASSDYSLSTTCGSSLAAQASCTVSVSFSPLAAGSRAASLMFTDSVASSPQTVALTGTGTQLAQATVGPASVNFSNQNLGSTSAPQSVTITNSGVAALSIYSVVLTGVNAGDFSMSSNCGATLAVAASCAVNVTFSPSGGGARSASLTFTDSANTPTQTVTLSGTGVSLFFNRVPGALAHLAIGADGAVWGINSSGFIYQYNASSNGWSWIPGNLSQIVVGSANAVWGLNSSGQIYHWDTSAQTWDWIAGALAQLAVGCDGDVWGLNSAGAIYHLDSQTNTWQEIPGTLAQIAVGSDGAVWGLNSAHFVYRFNPATQSFSQVAGALTQIFVGGDGDVWGLNNQSLFHFNQLTQSFDPPVSTALAQVTVGSGSNVYGLNSSNQVCQVTGPSGTCNWIPGAMSELVAGANGAVWGIDPAGGIWTLNQPTQATGAFHAMPGNFSQIAVGADGSTWALTSNGFIYSFNAATRSWTQVPGSLAQLAIASEGMVWGLNGTGSVYRFNPSSQSWTQIPGSLAHLAIGANGAVWGLNSSGQIYSFNASAQAWTEIPGNLSQIAIGADGTAWGLNSGGQNYRFDSATGQWHGYPGTFSQISVGAGNNVWALGSQGQVYEFNTQAGAWKLMPGTLARISPAFDGEVWGVDSSHQVFRFDPQTQTWTPIAGALVQLAVASDAAIWGLDASGAVYRFQ